MDLIKKEYASIFPQENEETIADLSELTKGYAFAYQVVGYLFSKYGNIESMLEELDQYLASYVYDKIWSVLPGKERMFLRNFKTVSITTEQIMNTGEFNDKSYGVYRDRLIKRGLINSPEHGIMSLVLPRFEVFISKQE